MAKAVFNRNHPTHKYALDIIDKKIVAGELEILAAKRHIRDLERQGKNYDYVFDHTRAERIFKFFEMCFDVERNEYYKLLPHQYFDFGLQFGWVHKETGIYRFVTTYKQQAKGNAKTSECAIKGLYKLIAERVYKPFDVDNFRRIHNSQIYMGAVDKTQVDELREPMVAIAKNSPKIKPFVDAKKTYIRGAKFGGRIIVLSKSPANKHGSKPDYIIIDEYASHPNDNVVSALNLGKKEQAQKDIITTAGDWLETNPAKKEYNYAKMVLRDEVRDERYLAIIRQQDNEDEMHDPNTWAKSSPMLRYIGKEKYASTLFDAIKDEYKKAVDYRDLEAQRKFKIFRMNLWQEGAVNSYLKSHELKLLDECMVSKDEFSKLIHGKKKVTGFDFSARRDLTAGGDVFLLDDGRLAIDAFGYMPVETMKRQELTDRVPYGDWAKAGWLELTNYPVTNKEEFAHIVCRRTRERENEIKEITYDKYFAYDLIVDFIDGKYDDLGAGNFSENNVIEIPQNVRALHTPTTMLRDYIIQKKIVWNGNPLLKWCFVNAFEFKTQTGDLIKIMKESKTSNKRIDLLAAVINAIARCESLKAEAWIDRMATAEEFF